MDARAVTDQFEWSALSRLAPTFAHDWSWAQMCAEQVRVATFQKIPVRTVYVRCWVDDQLIGCPLLILGEEPNRTRSLVVPRATPMTLSPGDADPTAALLAANPDVELDDSAALQQRIAELHAELAHAEPVSRRWSCGPSDSAAMGRCDSWASDGERGLWLRWLARLWRGAWRSELVTYRDPTGWVVRVHRDGYDAEVVTVLVDGAAAPPWMSPRLRT